VSEWISVDERLPEMRKPYTSAPYMESEQVLATNGHYSFIAKYADTYTQKKRRWEDHSGRVAHVTHWMPLPTPPAARG